jgi:enterobactin synthetase component F
MVASTVGKLSALLARRSAMSRRSAWGMKPSAAARKRRPDAVLLPSGVRFCLAVQRAGALSQPALVDYRHSVAATGRADAAARRSGWRVEHHLATLLAQQPHGPYYLLGYSLGGTLAQGIAARLRQRGEAVAFLGLLDTWPPETQNWAEKEANGLDPECWRKSSASAGVYRRPAGAGFRRAV